MQPIVEFILELDKLKGVTRKTRPLGLERYENSAEHSWQIALLAASLVHHAEIAASTLDRVIRMLLVHDIGEIDTGDTMVYTEGGWEERKAAEAAAARRIFGLLPGPQGARCSPSGRSSKTRATAEARFAHAVDRAMPACSTWRTRARAGGRTASATRASSAASPPRSATAARRSGSISRSASKRSVCAAGSGRRSLPERVSCMRIAPPNRVSHRYVQKLVAGPAQVFPLLCPVREAEWIEGWDPLVVWSASGVAEPDCVFVTAAAPHEAIWYVARHEPGNGFVEMLKITPGVTACRLTIQLTAVATGCEAEITYTHTSLGPAGDEFVAGFTVESYRQFMQEWEARMNHYLATGESCAEKR